MFSWILSAKHPVLSVREISLPTVKPKHSDCKIATKRFLIMSKTTTYQIHSKFHSVNDKITRNELGKYNYVSLPINRWLSFSHFKTIEKISEINEVSFPKTDSQNLFTSWIQNISAEYHPKVSGLQVECVHHKYYKNEPLECRNKI